MFLNSKLNLTHVKLDSNTPSHAGGADGWGLAGVHPRRQVQEA